MTAIGGPSYRRPGGRPSPRIVSDDGHVDAGLTDPVELGRVGLLVCEELADRRDGTDLDERHAAELGSVDDDHDVRGRVEDGAVGVRLDLVVRGEARPNRDAVRPDEYGVEVQVA